MVGAGLRIETARTVIAPSDGPSSDRLAHLVADPRVARWFSRRDAADTSSPRRWLQMPDDWPTHRRMVLAVTSRHDGAVIGAVSFDEARLAYFVAPDCWGLGHGTEMVGACCARAAPALALNDVRAEVIRGNVASQRVLAKLGFVYAGLSERRFPGRAGAWTVLDFRLRLPDPHPSQPRAPRSAEPHRSDAACTGAAVR